MPRRNPAIDTPADTPADDSTPAAVTPADDSTPAAVTPAAVTPADDSTAVVAPADPAPTPADVYVAAYLAAASAVGTPDYPGRLADAVAAYRNVPGGGRGGASRTALKSAARAGVDPDHACDVDDAVIAAASAASTNNTPAVDPSHVLADRVAALLAAIARVDVPTGADWSVAVSRVADTLHTLSGDASDTPAYVGHAVDWLRFIPPTPADTTPAVSHVADRAAAAAAAVSRGRGGRGTRIPAVRGTLADVADGALTYAHRGTTYRATLAGTIITLADGRTFDSPTAAASAVNGGVSVNGWIAWRLADGRTLDAASRTTPADADGGTPAA